MSYLNPHRPIAEQTPGQPDPTSQDAADLAAEYADLPAWVRRGAQLIEIKRRAMDDGYVPRTVVRITKTQIVCSGPVAILSGSPAEYRYRRSNLGRIAPGTHADGDRLADPNDPDVRDGLAVQALERVYLDVAAQYRNRFTHAGLYGDDQPRTVATAVQQLHALQALVQAALDGIHVREAMATTAAERATP